MSTGSCLFWVWLWLHFYWIRNSLKMGHFCLKTTPAHAFNFNTSFMSFVMKRDHVKYFKYWIGTSFYADALCWTLLTNFRIKKSIKWENSAIYSAFDIDLLNLDLQMLIDHSSFQSVQMLWSQNKSIILIIMQISCMYFLQILISLFALYFAGNVYQINIWWTTCNHRNNRKCKIPLF